MIMYVTQVTQTHAEMWSERRQYALLRQAQLPWWNQYLSDGGPAEYRTVAVPYQQSNASGRAV